MRPASDGGRILPPDLVAVGRAPTVRHTRPEPAQASLLGRAAYAPRSPPPTGGQGGMMESASVDRWGFAGNRFSFAPDTGDFCVSSHEAGGSRKMHHIQGDWRQRPPAIAECSRAIGRRYSTRQGPAPLLQRARPNEAQTATRKKRPPGCGPSAQRGPWAS